MSYWQTVTAESNKGRNFKIVIRPNILGSVKISVRARGAIFDGLEKMLRVVPEGIPQSIANSVLVLKNDSSSIFSTSLECVLPPTAVSDTISSRATIIGDLMGPVINGLDKLIRMSYGCGEQNLLNFVPSLVTLQYLETTGQLTDSLRGKAIGYAEAGYQRQLSYVHYDGSFSAFGKRDISGSTWLTAYSVSAFSTAQHYIDVDPNVISKAFSFFVNKQNADGSFREDGRVIHKNMQGGFSSGLAMTAFVSLVISENIDQFPAYASARDAALNYIAANVNTSDVYALCISTLALQLGNHVEFPTLYAAMIAQGTESDDQMYWSKPVPPSSGSNPWWYNQPKSVDIEMTAYALRVVAAIDLIKASKIAKYLISKKNSFGGYGSSQDTVQALKALSVYGSVLLAESGTIDFTLTPNIGSVINAQVNSDNLMVTQEFDLDPMARQLDVYSGVNSKGNAIVSLICDFYDVSEETAPSFNIRTQLIQACRERLNREVCISYIATEVDTESNMALVKVTLPSGYVYDNDQELADEVRVCTFEWLIKLNIILTSVFLVKSFWNLQIAELLSTFTSIALRLKKHVSMSKPYRHALLRTLLSRQSKLLITMIPVNKLVILFYF